VFTTIVLSPRLWRVQKKKEGMVIAATSTRATVAHCLPADEESTGRKKEKNSGLFFSTFPFGVHLPHTKLGIGKEGSRSASLSSHANHGKKRG